MCIRDSPPTDPLGEQPPPERIALVGGIGRLAQHGLLGPEQPGPQDHPAAHLAHGRAAHRPDRRRTGHRQLAHPAERRLHRHRPGVRRRPGLPLGPEAGPHGAGRTVRVRRPVQPRHRRAQRRERQLPGRRPVGRRPRLGLGRVRPGTVTPGRVRCPCPGNPPRIPRAFSTENPPANRSIVRPSPPVLLLLERSHRKQFTIRPHAEPPPGHRRPVRRDG